MLGRPTYFDVSVRCSLQFQFLTRAAVQAGAAGEAGENEKDNHHAKDVTVARGIFFPLIVQSLGLNITNYNNLQVLRTIALMETTLNGIPCGLAARNLLYIAIVNLPLDIQGTYICFTPGWTSRNETIPE